MYETGEKNMTFLKENDPMDDDEDFSFDEDDLDDVVEVEEDEEDEEDEEQNDEDIDELEKIESKIEKGEEAAISSLDSSVIPKSRIIYQCPLSKKIYWNNKWIKDNITDLYTLRTELAYCPKYIEKGMDLFIGSVEIFDKKIAERKESFISLANRIENELEDSMPFEKIIKIAEKNEILFIFTNTTRLASEIGKALRQEFQGGVKFEWYERNQYLRVKWYDTMENKEEFHKKIRMLKERRFGMFPFEEEV
jgi:hypothetical protein